VFSPLPLVTNCHVSDHRFPHAARRIDRYLSLLIATYRYFSVHQWAHPIIGIHMRLGVDKNREAQRFPTKYYIHEARRIRQLFSGGQVE